MSNREVVLPLFSGLAQAGESHKRYRTIVADPPWQYDAHWGAGIAPRPELAYGTMALTELCNLPVGLWATDDSCLFLWTTNSMLAESLQVAKAWGFEVKTMMTWIKGRIEHNRLIQQIGMGHYLRNSTEHILFAIRGRPTLLAHDVPTALVAPRGEHSEKPAAFYDLVEHVSPGPYLDVFARKQRLRWDSWGNEAFDFRTHGVFHTNEESAQPADAPSR